MPCPGSSHTNFQSVPITSMHSAQTKAPNAEYTSMLLYSKVYSETGLIHRSGPNCAGGVETMDFVYPGTADLTEMQPTAWGPDYIGSFECYPSQ
jgi:hypothetical protein